MFFTAITSKKIKLTIRIKLMNSYLIRLSRALTLFFLTIFPIILSSELWQELWTGVRPQAWDGSGHYTLAQIYSNSIFPDVFGWTNAFFGGMPHPNNYPPLFYWLIALLYNSQIVSFSTAFKIVLVIPVLLLPVATWFLTWRVSNKSELISFCAALSITLLLVDYRFFISSGPLGITYMSTFLTGLYSHPLGYLFLILWFAVYSNRSQPLWRIALSSLLLAFTFLSSFFGASVTALFVIATIIYDVFQLRRSSDTEPRQQVRYRLIGHLVSPVIAFCLTLFWLAPVIAARDYIVTQPSSVPFTDLVPPAMLVWYGFAVSGILLYLRERKEDFMLVYLATCAVFAAVIFSSGIVAPRWFPMHPARLIATLNFLLAIPVGIAFAFILRQLAKLLGITSVIHRLRSQPKVQSNRKPVLPFIGIMESLKTWQIIAIVLLVIFGGTLVFTVIKSPSYKLAYYPTADREAIDPILNFAKDHREGRYLVEIPPFSDIAAGHEGRAINNYLPAQRNEVLTLFFREVSPNVVFFSPIVDRFSVQADPSGISSVLSDDIDFAKQSAALHLQQARLIGVRYLVVRSPWARNILDREQGIKYRRDFGFWSVYVLDAEPKLEVHPLAYKPALLVSTLNLKGRRHNDWDFVRFAEEQLASGWYDVRLARSQEMKLDRLHVEDGFGALIIDTYEYDDQETAFERLREFARNRPLILLESDNLLFRRIQASLIQFPQAAIINRAPEETGAWLTPGAPSRSYDTSQIRGVWKQIQQILNERKIPVSDVSDSVITGQSSQNAIDINTSKPLAESVPVIVDSTYHPNWQRTDKGALYQVMPFFTLTFVREPAKLVFARCTSDWIGLIISAATFLLLCFALLWHYGNHIVKSTKFNRYQRLTSSEQIKPT